MAHSTNKSSPVHQSFWTFSTYFAEGFPYTIIRTISSFFFRAQGMSLEAVGVTSIFGLAWVLKFLWGPQVDAFSTKRKWLLLSETSLCLLFLLAAILTPQPKAVAIIAVLFFIGSYMAATHDIAIDGFYMEILDKNDQAKYLGYRVMAYRIAMMTGTGVVASIGAAFNWTLAFFLAAAVMILLLLLHIRILPDTENAKLPFSLPSKAFFKSHSFTILATAACIAAMKILLDSNFFAALKQQTPFLQKLTFPALINIALFASLVVLWLYRKKLHRSITANPEGFYARSFLAFIDRDHIGTILGFIIFIRSGEYMLSAMYAPFMVDLGLKIHYGWISAGIGLPCSIAGAMVGGWCISRYTLKKMLWPFLLLQNVTNLIYMGLALKLGPLIALNTERLSPVALSGFQLASVATVHAFDQFSGGLGTAVLMTFLMRICLPEFKASHYAIGTGLMSISGLYAGIVSGFLTSWLGYGLFFGVSFVISIPGMIFALFIPSLEGPAAD